MTIATDMLASYLAAEAAVLTAKTVQLNGRTLAHADLQDIELKASSPECGDMLKRVVPSRSARYIRTSLRLEIEMILLLS